MSARTASARHRSISEQFLGRGVSGLLREPSLLLVLLALAAALLLSVPVHLPIGANQWDLYFIIDGTSRVRLGQTPHADFFTPSGALPFYLTAAAELAFPRANPLLAAQYGTLLVTLPLMALAVRDVAARSRLLALVLAAPFALLSLLPINVLSFYPSPGADGMGVYNRQSGLVLYPFVAAVFLMRGGPSRIAVLAAALAALFFLKINAFVPALALLVFAPMASLLPWRSALGAGAAALAFILAAGLPTGLLGPYLADLGALAAHNGGHVLMRLTTLVSVKFDVVAALGVLVALLAFIGRRELGRDLAGLLRGGLAARRDAFVSLLAHDAARFASLSALAVLVEMQNTGSQEFAWLWPALLTLLPRFAGLAGRPVPAPWRAAVAAALALVALPTAMTLMHRGARMLAVMPGYVELRMPELGALGLVSVKQVHLDHARAMPEHYAATREAYAALSRRGQMPSTILMSEHEFQAFYLLDLAGVVTSLRAHEAREGARLDRIFVLDHIDIVSHLMGREPLKGVTVSLDLGRGFPATRIPRLLEAAATADAILIPRCPVTPFRLDLEKAAVAVLAPRRTVALNPCWDMSLRPGV